MQNLLKLKVTGKNLSICQSKKLRTNNNFDTALPTCRVNATGLVKKWNFHNIFILSSLFCLFSKNPKLYLPKLQSYSSSQEKLTLQHPTFEIFGLKSVEYLAQHIRLDRTQIFTVWQRVRTIGRSLLPQFIISLG